MALPASFRLNTVYVSQDGPGADLTFFDCGPACVLMLAKTVTDRDDLSVNDVSKLIEGGIPKIDKRLETRYAFQRRVCSFVVLDMSACTIPLHCAYAPR